MYNNLILFDGICNLCNGLVNFIIEHDKNQYFKFAPLQSSLADEILTSSNHDLKSLESIILIKEKEILIKSDAVFEIAKHLDGFWSWMVVFKYLPKTVRNYFYDLVARYRYRIFGTTQHCKIPDHKLAERFL